MDEIKVKMDEMNYAINRGDNKGIVQLLNSSKLSEIYDSTELLNLYVKLLYHEFYHASIILLDKNLEINKYYDDKKPISEWNASDLLHLTLKYGNSKVIMRLLDYKNLNFGNYTSQCVLFYALKDNKNIIENDVWIEFLKRTEICLSLMIRNNVSSWWE